MTAKVDLRRFARGQDPATPAENEAVGALIGALLRRLRPNTVLTFLAMPGELDPSPVASQLSDITWLVTRTPPHGWLTVHPLHAPRERHPFGYEQPVVAAEQVDEQTIDLILVPGLAFDLDGGRLGRGRGYYDELISRCRQGVVTVGITLDRCVVDRVPTEPHDRPMDWLITESGIRRLD